MLTPQELATMRFAMSAPPQPGGEPGIYEEQVAQWVAEKSFFRDFVYRNAKGKKKGTNWSTESSSSGMSCS